MPDQPQGVSQSPTQNTDASQRVQIAVAPRPAGACYDEATFQAQVRRLVLTLQNLPQTGPYVYQIAPPDDKSAIWIPLDNSAGYAAGVNHIWNGAAWVPVVTQAPISADENNAIFLDPSGGMKVNLPARLRIEQLCTGPAPTVTITWTAAQYSLGDEVPKVGWNLVATAPAAGVAFIETSRTSTSIIGKVAGLLTGEQVTMVLEFNQPPSKGE
jgi:hypothetical protein